MLRSLAVLGCLVLLAVGTWFYFGQKSAPSPSTTAPAPCSTEVLAGWRDAGLAVLWAEPPPQDDWRQQPRVALPAAVTAVDVSNGQVRSYCPLPAPSAGRVQQQDYALGMRQGGADYPPYLTDPDLMLRTQYFSPDFRWFSAPGLPLVDVATGRVIQVSWSGTVVGLGRGIALIRVDIGAAATWCTRPVPPNSNEGCEPLTAPYGPGSFVIGTYGTPVWVPEAAQPFAFGPVTGYAITDGTRLYGADYYTTAERRAQDEKLSPTEPPIDLDPTGRGGFITKAPTSPEELGDRKGWFTVESVDGGKIRTRYHRTTIKVPAVWHKGNTGWESLWMWESGSGSSRAIADSGRVAITAAPVVDLRQRELRTRFGALIDGSDKVVDLTKERGLHCPKPNSFCRILAWPNNSLGPATPAPSTPSAP